MTFTLIYILTILIDYKVCGLNTHVTIVNVSSISRGKLITKQFICQITFTLYVQCITVWTEQNRSVLAII